MDIEKLLLDLHGKMAAVTVSISEIKEDLRYHIKRTDQNESKIEIEAAGLRDKISRMEQNHNNEIKRLTESHAQQLEKINKHINRVQGGFKVIGIIGLVSGTILGLIKLFNYITGL